MKTYLKWLCIAALFMGVTACEDDPVTMNFQFNATIEPLQSSDPNAKVYLHNEEWIYWEVGDDISLGSNMTTDGTPSTATLVNASQNSDFADFNGVFIAPLPEGSKYFLGLHPSNELNVITGHGTDNNNFDDPTINLNQVQPRRQDGKHDITFAKQVFPMVACFDADWDAGHTTPYNLLFHSLAGVVRLELFNSAAEATINYIDFYSIDDAESDNLQLCGKFTVKNFNQFDPYPKSFYPSGPIPDSCRHIQLRFSGGLTLNNSDIRTFYLVLPVTDPNPTRTTRYHLRMTVNTTQGEFTKDFTVPASRNGLTNMRAIGVTAWSPSTTTSIGLAGHGTEARPFKIYTLEDLQYLRDHYNGDRKLNGQDITANTWISLMRTDITLTTSNWTSGIIDFEGHFTDQTHSNSNPHFTSTPGITNNSNFPLFTRILADGYVKDLTVKTSSASITTASTTGISPFCDVNRGTIEGCKVNGSFSASYNAGGIVGMNEGTIIGCECAANITLVGATQIGGICYLNKGTITGSYVSSALTMTSVERAGGICYENQGTVEECYFAGTISETTTNWGGIVYTNSTSTSLVQNCYFSNTGLIVSLGSAGGIVHTVANGTVDYCRLQGAVKAVQVGGIAHDITGGKVINCCACNASYAKVIDTVYGGAAKYCGGIAGTISGGSIENSFANDATVRATSSGPDIGGIVGTLTGGTITNCYSYLTSTTQFYGATTLSGDALNTALSYNSARCYIVDYSQTGVQMVSSDASGLSTLLGGLTANIPSGGHGWEGTPPRLTSTVSSSKKRF